MPAGKGILHFAPFDKSFGMLRVKVACNFVIEALHVAPPHKPKDAQPNQSSGTISKASLWTRCH